MLKCYVQTVVHIFIRGLRVAHLLDAGQLFHIPCSYHNLVRVVLYEFENFVLNIWVCHKDFIKDYRGSSSPLWTGMLKN